MSRGPTKPIESYPVADLSQFPPPPPPVAGDAVAEPAPAKPARAVATLTFVGGPLERVVTLAHPFVLDGATISVVTARPVPVVRLGEFYEQLPSDPDNFDAYALITGLPADVLRALPPPDGERVVNAAYDFLPLALRPAETRAG